MKWGPGVAAAGAPMVTTSMACYSCHLVDAVVRRLPSADRGKLEDHESHKFERGGDPQLRDLQPAGGARRHVPCSGCTRPPRATSSRRSGQSSALILSSTNINRERIYVQQPPIAASGFSITGVRRALPAHRAHADRDQDLHRLPPVKAANDNNAIMAQLAAQRHQLHQLRRHARLCRARRRASRRCGSPNGRAAGGVRLLPAQIRLSRFLQGAPTCRKERPRTDRLGARQDFRQGEGRAARPTRPRISATSSRTTGGAARCLQLRGEYLYVAEGKGGFTAYDVANIGNKDVSEKIVRVAVLAARARHAHRRAARRHLRRPADQPVDQRRAAMTRCWLASRRTPAKRIQSGTGVPPAVPLRRRHRRGQLGLVLVDIDTADRPRAAQQLLPARRDLEPRRRADRCPPRQPRRTFRLCRDAVKAHGRGRPRRSAASRASPRPCRWPTPGPARCSSAICS